MTQIAPNEIAQRLSGDEIIAKLTNRGIGQVSDPAQRTATLASGEKLVFPLFLGPQEGVQCNFVQLQEYFLSNAEMIRAASSKFGALFFKGVDIRSPSEWASVLYSSGLKEMVYAGGAAVRKLLVGRDNGEAPVDMQVLTTNESPPSQPIPFHHELAQTPDFPTHICFCCMESTCKGGSTPLCRSDEVFEWLEKNHPEFAKKIEEVGVKYMRVAPGEDDPSSALGRSWRSMFHVKTKEEATALAAKQGSTIEWLNDADDAGRVVTKLPAVRTGSNGRKVFLNQVVAAYFGWVDKRNELNKAVTFADGELLNHEVMVALQDFMVSVSSVFKWEPGEFVIVDNTVAYHSREPFEGRRRVVAAIANGTKNARPDEKALCKTMATLPSGDRMPMAGFGCWKVPADACADTIYNAIKGGCRLFDCASDYGNEELVGQGFKRALDEGIVKRSDLFVVSKLWNTFHRPERVREGMEKSLKDLGLDYLDLYLVHFPIALKYVPIETRYPGGWIYDPNDANPRMEPDTGVTYQQTWEAMEELVQNGDGKVKNIGVCNLSSVMMWQLLNYAKVKPAVLQVELHPHNTQQRLLRLCREQGVQVMAFSSFGASGYVELGMGCSVHPEVSLLSDETIKAVAADLKRTAGQVLLRWAVQRGTIVIPKTSKPERLVENLSLFDFELTAEQMSKIDALNGNKRYNDPGHFCEHGFNCFYPIYD